MRFIRAGYAEALELLAREGLRADMVYFDLGMSSMQVDTRERGFSYSYDAPLDMRMDPAQELSAREIVAEWDERRLARLLRDYGEERHAGAIARAIVAGARRRRSRRRSSWSTTINAASPRPPASPAGTPPSAPSRRCGSPSTTSSASSTARCRWPGAACARAACSPAISFHSLEDRRVKRFLAERARGCICPPDLPVCACGREPEAALLAPPRDRALAPPRSPPTRAPPRRACAPPASSTSEVRSDAASRRSRRAPAGAAARAAAARAPRRRAARRGASPAPRARVPRAPHGRARSASAAQARRGSRVGCSARARSAAAPTIAARPPDPRPRLDRSSRSR